MTQALKHQFLLFDPDNTGHITFVNLRTGLHKLGVRAANSTILQLINEIDLDQNGEIEFDEFARVRRRWGPPRHARVRTAVPPRL